MNKAKRLKILRMLSGLTQDALSEITGINRALFSNWESDKHGPASKRVSVIAQALSTHPDYIIYGSNPPQDVIWEPMPPHANGGYAKQYLSDFEQLLPQFWQENKFTEFAHATFSCGGLLLFAGKGKAFDCAVLVPPTLTNIVKQSILSFPANVVGEVDDKLATISKKHLAEEIVRLSPHKISEEHVTSLLSKTRRQQTADTTDHPGPIAEHGLTVKLSAEDERQATLIIKGEFGSVGYAVNKITGDLQRICVCGACDNNIAA